ncbi:hypothetical protein BLA39750_03557 [Burkholderia lata]|uniref:Uncharacterized protein n=1 Tax=Burkholderia lata (strain ATCC 17760 / DSM 23089 / LMG 22485 / NCIMB 9086 / R18194 / 383) TaxID=482957 RepID=A0A6P2Y5N9_BURL3|nr:hypothetical protein BLA39750_03557 [Burkholderia lata]
MNAWLTQMHFYDERTHRMPNFPCSSMLMSYGRARRFG